MVKNVLKISTHLSVILQPNKWNEVGASYDNMTGVAQLWHDGKMVESRNIGQIQLRTQFPIRIGADSRDKRHFKGKISCVQIYDRALTAEQVGLSEVAQWKVELVKIFVFCSYWIALSVQNWRPVRIISVDPVSVLQEKTRTRSI